MKRNVTIVFAALTALAIVAVGLSAIAQAPPATATKPASTSKALGLIVFPAKSQTPDQQQKDEYDCYVWAKGQTNYDPIAPPPTPTAVAAEQKKGGAAKGAARGAAGGAAIGAIAGDAGTGAAAGAAAGAVRGRRQQKASEKQAEQKAAADQKAASAAPRDQYKKAFSACLEGKGYTVK